LRHCAQWQARGVGRSMGNATISLTSPVSTVWNIIRTLYVSSLWVLPYDVFICVYYNSSLILYVHCIEHLISADHNHSCKKKADHLSFNTRQWGLRLLAIKFATLQANCSTQEVQRQKNEGVVCAWYETSAVTGRRRFCRPRSAKS